MVLFCFILEIVSAVKLGAMPVFRPYLPSDACADSYRKLMERCWSERPIERLEFTEIKRQLSKISGHKWVCFASFLFVAIFVRFTLIYAHVVSGHDVTVQWSFFCPSFYLPKYVCWTPHTPHYSTPNSIPCNSSNLLLPYSLYLNEWNLFFYNWFVYVLKTCHLFENNGLLP